MRATNDESKKKALIETWKSKEAVPINQAVFGTGRSSDSLLLKAFKYIASNPMYIFGILYFVKKFLRYLEELGRDEIEGQKEL